MFAREAKKTISSPKIAATTGRPTKPTLPNAVTRRAAPTSSACFVASESARPPWTLKICERSPRRFCSKSRRRLLIMIPEAIGS